MKYVYLVYLYVPKHRYGYYITEGQYKTYPKVFENYKKAQDFRKKYKHASFIKKVKLN